MAGVLQELRRLLERTTCVAQTEVNPFVASGKQLLGLCEVSPAQQGGGQLCWDS